MKLKVKKLNKLAVTPTKAYKGDAGLDIYSTEMIRLIPYQPLNSMETGYVPTPDMYCIKTGISFEIPEGYYGEISDRSSLGMKGIYVFPGIIDSGFRGEVIVWLQNFGQKDYVINKGDKIAQLILKPIIEADIIESSELSVSERNTKGHGSSGK